MLLGPSGSGKTTLLKLLAGLLDTDKGEILLDGTPIEGPDKRLVPGYEEIRLVHQDFQLKFKMSVAENIRYELLAYVQEYQQERIEFLLDLFSIEHLRNTDVAQLSGGEKQRVAIARGLAHEPDVLLMDEPFSNLDLGTKSSILAEIRHLAKETNTAIILVTHDTRDALEVADEIVVIHHGSIIRQGTPHEIYFHPATPVVANLFGPYNILDHKLISKINDNKVSPGSYGVWPEHVTVAMQGIKAKVVHQTFMGSHWKVSLKLDGVDLLTYANNEITSKEVNVKISNTFDLANN